MHSPHSRNMRALVLSGGGGFGSYQVGAWRALSEANWRPDVILGTSIGAVNAFLISRGVSADELCRIWLELPTQLAPTNGRYQLLPYTREIPRFRAWTAEIARRYGKRPLCSGLQVCMAELRTGAMRVVEGQAVTGRHLLAACALPPLMRPVSIDGRLCVDGGTLYPVPLKEAVATGADEIVAVDLLRGTRCNAPRILRLTTLWIRNLLRGETHKPAPEDLARIRLRHLGHPTSLGTIRQCFEWNPGRVELLMEMGYHDTAAALRPDE
jgi:predicted acylesterase/phospholipase RssA